MRVLLNDPPLQRQGSRYPLHSLDDLMNADILTVHVPLTRSGPDATYHLFDETRLRKLKRGAIFFNTSRGSVMETEGLKRVLRDKHLSAAVLDVWEGEPKIDLSLLDLVFLGTPHIAGYSLDGKMNALRMNYEAVCHFMDIPVNYNIMDLIPSPHVLMLKIDSTEVSIEMVLERIVKQRYDILLDDRNLRQIVLLPDSDRGRYFSQLRAEYRVRREFSNLTISGPGKENNISEMLHLLGFQVKPEERTHG